MATYHQMLVDSAEQFPSATPMSTDQVDLAIRKITGLRAIAQNSLNSALKPPQSVHPPVPARTDRFTATKNRVVPSRYGPIIFKNITRGSSSC